MREARDENERVQARLERPEGEAADVGVERVARSILAGEPVAYSWPVSRPKSDLQRAFVEITADWYAVSMLCRPPEQDDAG